VGEIRRAFGKAVRIARVRKGWSQQQLAETASLARSHLSNIERGTKDPGLEVQERIARALGLSLPELLTAAEHERAHGLIRPDSTGPSANDA